MSNLNGYIEVKQNSMSIQLLFRPFQLLCHMLHLVEYFCIGGHRVLPGGGRRRARTFSELPLCPPMHSRVAPLTFSALLSSIQRPSYISGLCSAFLSFFANIFFRQKMNLTSLTPPSPLTLSPPFSLKMFNLQV